MPKRKEARAADGNLVPLLTGAGLIAVGLVLLQWLKAKMLRRRNVM